MTRKEQADHILYSCGLLAELSRYGAPYIVGSYRMDMMAWNDLDIDVENSGMSLERLHGLTRFVLEQFHPTWYEAKEEIGPDGKRVWFQGFETQITGELWNVDLWFFDQKAIRSALDYCDGLARQADAFPQLRERTIRLKQGLIARGLYPSGPYASMDVYEAVFHQNISDAAEFLLHRSNS